MKLTVSGSVEECDGKALFEDKLTVQRKMENKEDTIFILYPNMTDKYVLKIDRQIPSKNPGKIVLQGKCRNGELQFSSP